MVPDLTWISVMILLLLGDGMESTQRITFLLIQDTAVSDKQPEPPCEGKGTGTDL